jgi:hypothetical protein
MYTVLIAVVALWLIFNCCHSRGSAGLLVRLAGASLLVAAFFAPRFFLQSSKTHANVFQDALTCLSEADLKKSPKSSSLR